MCSPPGVCASCLKQLKNREGGKKKTCWWLNNVFILCAVRNTYSVGTRRIGYSLASDQIINMQRIITKWCVVRQNCVKCIMNWYAWCLRALLFFPFSSPLLQHEDAKALCAWEQTMDFIFASLLLMMKCNRCGAISGWGSPDGAATPNPTSSGTVWNQRSVRRARGGKSFVVKWQRI